MTILCHYFDSFDVWMGSVGADIFRVVSIRQGGIPYLFTCLLSPLLFLASGVGLVSAWRRFGSYPGSPIILFLFLVIFPMQFLDALTFLGIIRINHEIYYMRLYTPFIGLAFGYVIWLIWMERERRAEATLRVGQLAQGVVHDLRSPLAVLNVLSKTIRPHIGGDERALLEGAIQRIDSIVANLLDEYRRGTQHEYSRGIETTASGVASITNLVEEAVKEVNYLLAGRDCGRVEMAASSEAVKSVICKVNAGELRRALSNILNNAIEAARENLDKFPTSILAIASVRLNESGDWIEVTVEDSGNGVSDQLVWSLNRKKFGKSSKTGGHGLGLAEVWRIVQAHRGQLSFHQTSTGGLLVRLALPL